MQVAVQWGLQTVIKNHAAVIITDLDQRQKKYKWGQVRKKRPDKRNILRSSLETGGNKLGFRNRKQSRVAGSE